MLALALAAGSALAVGGAPAERCFAWTRAATGADAAADATRFGRAYLACLASVGYETPPPDGVMTSPPSVLVVGRPVAFRPGPLPVSVICDDLSVVRVDDAGTFLWLTGLKPGETSCSFGNAAHAGRRAVYHFVVRGDSTQ
jgi:hypothetical protein